MLRLVRAEGRISPVEKELLDRLRHTMGTPAVVAQQKAGADQRRQIGAADVDACRRGRLAGGLGFPAAAVAAAIDLSPLALAPFAEDPFGRPTVRPLAHTPRHPLRQPIACGAAAVDRSRWKRRRRRRCRRGHRRGLSRCIRRVRWCRRTNLLDGGERPVQPLYLGAQLRQLRLQPHPQLRGIGIRRRPRRRLAYGPAVAPRLGPVTGWPIVVRHLVRPLAAAACGPRRRKGMLVAACMIGLKEFSGRRDAGCKRRHTTCASVPRQS